VEAIMEFEDKVVIITGAAGTLGRAVAAAFEERHASLVLVDRQHDALTGAFGEAREGRRLLAACDLLDARSVAAMVDTAVQRFGRVDVLCNIAGGFRMGEAVHETSDETWDFLLDLNARTLLNTVRAAVPRMLAAGGGKVVNVGAFSAQKGVARMGAYVASKSAVIRLTETMAAELREQGINVNCVLPTIIDTPENRKSMPDADPSRWVAPGDLAATIVFLASESARAIHGAAIPVTGLS
jgi:NAD(P)-dependent dehydrogenase (short-subunit alcohol dehydrogenase family)